MTPTTEVAVPGSQPRRVSVFLCYRRNDGGAHAEWLHRNLDDAEYQAADGAPCRIRVYFDKTAPGVADWRQLHFPSLQTSHALIVVCTPGIAKDLSSRGRPDWVYRELKWWVRNRKIAPIVVDVTSEGDRWLPNLVQNRWPNINRIDVPRQIEAADAETTARVRQRVLDTIQQSERATVFEDLERFRRLNRRLLFAFGALVLALMLATIEWRSARSASRAQQQLNQEQQQLNQELQRVHLIDDANDRALLAKGLTGELALNQQDALLVAIQAYRDAPGATTRSVLTSLVRTAPRPVRTFHHSSAVTHIALTDNPSVIATGGDDQCVRTWNVETGALVAELRGSDPVRDLAFSAETHELWVTFGPPRRTGSTRKGQLVRWRGTSDDPGRRVEAVGDILGFVQSTRGLLVRSADQLFSTAGGRLQRLAVQIGPGPTWPVFDGHLVAHTTIPRGTQVNVFDIMTAKETAPPAMGRAIVESLAISGQGLIAIGRSDGTTEAIDIASKRHVLHHGYSDPDVLSISPDGAFVVEVDVNVDDQFATVWRVSTGQNTTFTYQTTAAEPRFYVKTAFSSDSSMLAISTGDGRLTWLRRNGDDFAPIGNASRGVQIRAIRFLPSSDHLVTADDAGDVIIWTPPTPALVEHRGIAAIATSTAASSSRYAVVTTSAVELYDTQTRGVPSLRVTIPPSDRAIAHMSQDDHYLATTAGDDAIIVVDLNTRAWPPLKLGAQATALAWSRPEQLIVATRNGVKRASLPSGEIHEILSRPLRWPTLSPDGARLADASEHEVYVHDLISGKHWTLPYDGLFGPLTFDEHHHLAVRKDARTLVLVDPASGAVDQSLAIEDVESKAWSCPRLHRLAVSDRSEIYLIDTEHPQTPARRLDSPHGNVTALAFSPTKAWLAIGHADGTVQLISSDEEPLASFPHIIDSFPHLSGGDDALLQFTGDGRYLLVSLDGHVIGLVPVLRDDIIGMACTRVVHRSLAPSVWHDVFKGRDAFKDRQLEATCPP